MGISIDHAGIIPGTLLASVTPAVAMRASAAWNKLLMLELDLLLTGYYSISPPPEDA